MGEGETKAETRCPGVVWRDMFGLELTSVTEIQAFKVNEYPEVWINDQDPAVQAAMDAFFDQELAKAKAQFVNHMDIESPRNCMGVNRSPRCGPGEVGQPHGGGITNK